MDTGFNFYHGADPAEYDLVLSNSEGGLERLRELGARRAEAVFWARRPGALPRRSRWRRSTTSSSTATATSSGASGCRRSSASRAGAARRSTSRSAGSTSAATSGGRASIGDVPFNVFAARDLFARASTLNITRRSHAIRLRVVDVPPVRARGGGRGDRLEPARGDRALVRARPEIRVVVVRRRGARGLPRAARRSGQRRGDGTPGARARPRRAHLRPPRAAAPRSRRALPARARAWLSWPKSPRRRATRYSRNSAS